MPKLNKEQAVFTAVLLLVGLLLFTKVRGMEDAPVGRIKSKGIDEVEWVLPDIRVTDRDETIWSFDRRDVFAIPKEVVDLPPVEMDLPPLPPRPIVSPPLDVMPPPDGWHLIAQAVPDSLANGRVIEVDDLDLFLDDVERAFEDETMAERVEADPTIDPFGRIDAIRSTVDGLETVDFGEIPESIDHLAALFEVAGSDLDRALENAAEPLRDLYTRVTGRTIGDEAAVSDEAIAAVIEATEEAQAAADDGVPALESWDRLVIRGQVEYGRLIADDPLALLGEETIEAGRYEPVDGVEIRFALVNERNGRPIGTTIYRADQVEAIELAETLENQIALRERKLKGDVPGRLALARWCEEQEAWDKAIEHYSAALEQDLAFNRDAAFGLVSVYRKDYRWDELADHLEKLVERGIEDARLEFERGALLERLGVDAGAEAALERCVNLDPSFAAAWVLLGDLRYERGDADAAYEAYRRAERAATSDPEVLSLAFVGEAKSRWLAGRTDDAIATVERGLGDAGQFDMNLRLLHATLLAKIGRFDRARSALLGLDPKNEGERRRIELVRGLIETRAGNFFEARAALETARDLDVVDTFWPNVVLGFANLTTGRREAAFDALDAAIRERPDVPYAHYLLGRFYLTTGDVDSALASFRTAYEMAPDVTEILGELGRTLLLADAPKDARLYLDELVRRRPDSAGAHALLAVACLADRDYEAARASADAALSREDELPVAMVARAFLDYRDGGEGVYTSIGALDRAAEILSATPDHPLANYARTYRAEIEDNRSKARWTDGFNRLQIKRDWEVNQRHGVQVRLADGRIHFEGTQRPRNEELTFIEREMEFRQVVRLEARLRAPLGEKARVGISLTLRRKRGEDELQGGLLFGRTTRGELAYKVVERGDEGDWTVLSESWPRDEWVSLVIENHDVKEGHFRLLVNGEEVARDIEVRALRKPRSPVRVGAFGTAGIGTKWTLDIDDVDVVMIKEES